jgi:very-short-patch-repair endonuclease
MDRFKARARALRSSQTSAEARLWYVLRGRRLLDWKFRRQQPIDRYVVDFVTFAGRLIVEVDGATHSSDGERQHDAKRSDVLTSLGFHILRVANTDIYEDLPGVGEAILRELAIGRFSPLPEGEVDGVAGG